MSQEGDVVYQSEGNAIRKYKNVAAATGKQQIDCRFGDDGRYIFNNDIRITMQGNVATGEANASDHLHCIGQGKYKYPRADGFMLNMPEIHIQLVSTISYVVLLSDGLDAKFTTVDNKTSRANVESVLRGIHSSVAAGATISKTMTDVFKRTSFSDNLSNDDCSLAIAVLNPPPVRTHTIMRHIAKKIISESPTSTYDYELMQFKTFLLFVCGAVSNELKMDDGKTTGCRTPNDKKALIERVDYDIISGMLNTKDEDYDSSSLENTLFMYEPYFIGYLLQSIDLTKIQRVFHIKKFLHIMIDTFVSGLRTHSAHYKDLYDRHLRSATFGTDKDGHVTAKRDNVPIRDYLLKLIK
jgi:hypothetical protein